MANTTANNANMYTVTKWCIPNRRLPCVIKLLSIDQMNKNKERQS